MIKIIATITDIFCSVELCKLEPANPKLNPTPKRIKLNNLFPIYLATPILFFLFVKNFKINFNNKNYTKKGYYPVKYTKFKN